MNKIYVVAGNIKEFRAYVDKKCADLNMLPSNFTYVVSGDELRGLTEVHGVFIGSFRYKHNLESICRQIRLVNNIPASEMLFPAEPTTFKKVHSI